VRFHYPTTARITRPFHPTRPTRPRVPASSRPWFAGTQGGRTDAGPGRSAPRSRSRRAERRGCATTESPRR